MPSLVPFEWVYLFFSTPAVESMSVSRRQCLNKNDMNDLPKLGIKLDAFQNYTQEACLLECRAETIFGMCGCLPYYYPDFSKVWRKNTTCDLAGLKCLAKTLSKIG